MLRFGGLDPSLCDKVLGLYMGIDVEDVICLKCTRQFSIASSHIIYLLAFSYFLQCETFGISNTLQTEFYLQPTLILSLIL